MHRADLAHVAGIAETTLLPEILASLPDRSVGAPWRCKAQAVVWLRRADRRTRETLRAALPADIRSGSLPVVAAGVMVRYLDTPVGPYSEVFGAVGCVGAGAVWTHVPFMVVDSPSSLVGGRANWALPKTLGQFEGEPMDGTTMTARGDTWEIRATPTAFGPAVPGAAPMVLKQRGPDGAVWSTSMRSRGRARFARIAVEIKAEPTLADWFPAGRCLGLVVESATLTLKAPRTKG